LNSRFSLYSFFALNYFAQGLAGIAYEPISYILKDSLGLDAAGSAAFVSWMTLPFLVKPLLGLFTDLGSRRRVHLALGAGLGVLAWGWLGLGGKPTYGVLLAALIVAHASFVFCDVVCDGVMVEASRKLGTSARFQSVQIASLYLALILTGWGGGWLTVHAKPSWIFLATAGLSLLTLASAALAPDSPRRPQGVPWKFLASPAFWRVSGVIFLWNFAPFLGTAQFYFQSEHLKLDPIFIGTLSTASGFAGVAGAALFPALAGRSLLKAGVLVGVPLQLLYFFYTGKAGVLAVTVLLSLAGVIFRLALMEEAARSSPEGSEATAFAAYMAVFNLAALASNALGGKVYTLLEPDRALGVLCLVAALTTLASWPLVRASSSSASRPG
jgi:predicted MFS family arabinose efflux permease